MKDDRCSGVGSVLFAFVLGGIVGAGLTALLAPLSGPEARQKLSEMRDDVQDRTDDFREQSKERLSSAVSKGRSYLDEKKSVISKALEAGKDAYSKEKSQES
jgi:gas vesicle protein